MQQEEPAEPVVGDERQLVLHARPGLPAPAGLQFRAGEAGRRSHVRAGQLYASPVLADGKLYYVGRDGKTFVLPAKPEFKILATNDLRDRSLFSASPAIADGRLIIRSDKYLYCIGKQ